MSNVVNIDSTFAYQVVDRKKLIYINLIKLSLQLAIPQIAANDAVI